MTVSELAYLDPLSIPDTPIGGYASVMKILALGLFGFLFVCAILNEQVKMIGGEPGEMGKIVKRGVLILIGIVLYRYIFTKIVAICQIIGMSLCSMEDYSKFQSVLTAFGTKVSTGNILQLGVVNLSAGLFTLAAIIAEAIFGIIRYFFLAILYVIGPLAMVTAMLPATASMMKGWFKKVLQISFWIIIVRATEAIMLSLRMEQALTGSNSTMDFMVMSGVLIAMIILTPTLTEAVLSDANLGAMTGAVTGMLAAGGAHAMAPLSHAGAAAGGAILGKAGLSRWTGTHGFAHEIAQRIAGNRPQKAEAGTPDKTAPKR